MEGWICVTCGNEAGPSDAEPERCVVCEDPRQYVGWEGQRWTTLARLSVDHATELREVEDGLWGIGVSPPFAIGQRGLIVATEQGNVLWDVPGFVDESAFDAVEKLGGLAAISASHPHFYGVMTEWSRRFDAPIVLPESDRQFIMRLDAPVEFYTGEAVPVPGIRVIRCGGHFPGSAVLHWPAGAGGRGVLLTGDTVQVARDRDRVSVMWSYPNMIPVNPVTIDQVEATLERLRYDRIYGGWWDSIVSTGAPSKVAGSFDRYRRIITDGPPDRPDGYVIGP